MGNRKERRGLQQNRQSEGKVAYAGTAAQQDASAWGRGEECRSSWFPGASQGSGAHEGGIFGEAENNSEIPGTLYVLPQI